MKCTIAKHNSLLLQQAIQHYRKSAQIFTFPSLYDDFEPYPINEVVDVLTSHTRYGVIQVLEQHLNAIQSEIDSFTKMTSGLRKNERLETSFYTTKKHLEMMRKRKQEIGNEM